MFRVVLCMILILASPSAHAACRQALVLALDVSSSVDDAEYSLQMQWLAGVLSDPEVQDALLANPKNPVMLAIFEWAGRDDQRLILGWTRLVSKTDLAGISAILMQQGRKGGTRSTAIGRALTYAGDLLEQVPDCWQHTVDISADGKNNDGYRPKIGKQAAVFQHVVVNGLVIGKAYENTSEIAGNVIAELNAYFNQEILHGPDAFVETALGFQDFARAMKKKIMRETSMAIAAGPGARQLTASLSPLER